MCKNFLATKQRRNEKRRKAVAIKECQEVLQTSLSSRLAFIHCHLAFLPTTITTLEKAVLHLIESLSLSWKMPGPRSKAYLVVLASGSKPICPLYTKVPQHVHQNTKHFIFLPLKTLISLNNFC